MNYEVWKASTRSILQGGHRACIAALLGCYDASAPVRNRIRTRVPADPSWYHVSSSTYGKYYAEILRTEGLNEFAVADIGTVTRRP